MIVGHCDFCHEPCDDRLHRLARQVTGWEPVRKGGGGNALADRIETESKIAHLACAQRAGKQRRRGIAPEQGALL